MATWTAWRKIADRDFWYDDEFDHDGPACYELAIGGPKYGNIRTVYVGETANEKKRLSAYAQHGSHLSEIIASHLRQGWTLYYRAIAKPTKSAAKQLQNNLLHQFDYDWNLQLNPKEE
ncbi:MAG TPA: hypothetical protein VN739_03045 [Nitrososphaerales archaeon]|nr:hypothetical protein [Nitrososphaerales archaeon]